MFLAVLISIVLLPLAAYFFLIKPIMQEYAGCDDMLDILSTTAGVIFGFWLVKLAFVWFIGLF